MKNDPSNFRRRVKGELAARRISLSQLAERIKLSRNAVSRCVNGGEFPGVRAAIAKELLIQDEHPSLKTIKSRARKFFAVIQDLNARLRAKRLLKEKGWSQTAAARQLGIGRAQLNRILNGRRHSARLLQAIETLPSKP